MSTVQSRPTAPRGRASHRGGRGSSRGGRGGGKNSKSEIEHPIINSENEGEIGELKKKYASQASTIQELFPDWTEEDALFALEETDGDLESTIERITNGKSSIRCDSSNLFLTRSR